MEVVNVHLVQRGITVAQESHGALYAQKGRLTLILEKVFARIAGKGITVRFWGRQVDQLVSYALQGTTVPVLALLNH